MQPGILLCLVMVGISVVSVITVAGVALIALGTSGALTPSSNARSTAIVTVTTTTASPTVLTNASSTASTTTTITTVTTSTTTTVTTSTTVVTTTTTSTTVVTTTTPILANQIAIKLSNISLFPSKSYSAALSSFSQASSNYSLLPLDQTILSQLGNIDNASSALEAGRLQYLFFRVPGSASRTKRSEPSDSHRLVRATPDAITAIALNFGPVASSNILMVIPIPGSNETNATDPGVSIALTLPDGSVVIRVVLSVPTSLCPTVNGKSIDACINVIYQAYAIVNNNSISPMLSLEINAACGDICSLTSACSTTCTTCDGSQVEGYDTPVTRRYNIGANAATFVFEYETYTIKDRVTVWNAGTLLFDTGCVGANGITNVTYSSSSPSIRVDVEPNCDCASPFGCGTAWYFVVRCLNQARSKAQTLALPNLELERQLLKH